MLVHKIDIRNEGHSRHRVQESFPIASVSHSAKNWQACAVHHNPQWTSEPKFPKQWIRRSNVMRSLELSKTSRSEVIK